MRIYQKFGNTLAVLLCIAAFVMCAVLVIKDGVSTVDTDTGVTTYFYEKSDFQGYLFVALSFLVSAVATSCATEVPLVAAGISLLPLAMTFYQFASDNLFEIVAAIVLLLAMIHVACNVLAWWDQQADKAKEKALAKANEENNGEQVEA